MMFSLLSPCSRLWSQPCSSAGLGLWSRNRRKSALLRCPSRSGPEREGQRISADFLLFLDHSPSPAEEQGWLHSLEQGLSNENIIDRFVGTSTYFQNQGGTPANWLYLATRD